MSRERRAPLHLLALLGGLALTLAAREPLATPSARGRLELEVFAASGALTRGQAEAALLRRRAGFLACYERALLEQRAAGNFAFAGQTELSVGVTPSGLTERVDLLSSTFTEAALSSCLRRIASGVRYPAARAGGSLSVRLRFAPAT